MVSTYCEGGLPLSGDNPGAAVIASERWTPVQGLSTPTTAHRCAPVPVSLPNTWSSPCSPSAPSRLSVGLPAFSVRVGTVGIAPFAVQSSVKQGQVSDDVPQFWGEALLRLDCVERPLRRSRFQGICHGL